MTTTPPFCLWVDESVLRSFFIFISPALFIIPVIIMNEGISVLLFPREEKQKKKRKEYYEYYLKEKMKFTVRHVARNCIFKKKYRLIYHK